MRKLNVISIFISALFMLLGLYLSLIRSGFDLPARGLAGQHAQVMIVGFLGSLIALERAVAIRRTWGKGGGD